MTAIVSVSSGTARCDIHPAVGGSIGCWSINGQPMMRTAVDVHDPLGMATFPLVPYSNRIGNARFAWAGRTIDLVPNFPPEPHAIHGIGWKRPWTVIDQSAEAVTLKLAHPGDAHWPWPFAAEQRIAISNDSLILTLLATNLAEIAVPLGFGHHPYFDADGASLAFAADHVWMSGPDALPTSATLPVGHYDFSQNGAVARRSVDHCYTGVRGAAGITWADRPLGLEISTQPALPAAVVYVPKGGDAFCFEPVPHVNNALNMECAHPAVPIVGPGQTTKTVLSFTAR